MARQIEISDNALLKKYSTEQRCINAMSKLPDDIMYIVVPLPDGKFTPVITNALATGCVGLAHKGYMIVG